MGLIINDNIPLKIGTNKKQCYFNIGNEPIIINRNSKIPGLYNITTTFCIYYDHESYLKGGGCIDKKHISIQIRNLNNNLYEILYNKLKEFYNSSINI
jgi:hypothetical protein